MPQGQVLPTKPRTDSEEASFAPTNALPEQEVFTDVPPTEETTPEEEPQNQ